MILLKKTEQHIVGLFILIFIASCSNSPFSITKRVYKGGWYVSTKGKINKDKIKNNDEVAPKVISDRKYNSNNTVQATSDDNLLASNDNSSVTNAVKEYNENLISQRIKSNKTFLNNLDSISGPSIFHNSNSNKIINKANEKEQKTNGKDEKKKIEIIGLIGFIFQLFGLLLISGTSEVNFYPVPGFIMLAMGGLLSIIGLFTIIGHSKKYKLKVFTILGFIGAMISLLLLLLYIYLLSIMG